MFSNIISKQQKNQILKNKLLLIHLFQLVYQHVFHNLGFVDVILVTRVQRSKAVEEVVKIIPLTVQLVDIKAVAEH